MQSFKDTDSGVSPVIGVILMVAVTVILAAVIGTFIISLGDGVQENPQAAVTFENTNDRVEFLIVSAGNVDSLRIQGGGEGSTWPDAEGNEDLTVENGDLIVNNPSAGDSYSYEPPEGEDVGDVVVSGTVGGNEVVIRSDDYDVTSRSTSSATGQSSSSTSNGEDESGESTNGEDERSLVVDSGTSSGSTTLEVRGSDVEDISLTISFIDQSGSAEIVSEIPCSGFCPTVLESFEDTGTLAQGEEYTAQEIPEDEDELDITISPSEGEFNYELTYSKEE